MKTAIITGIYGQDGTLLAEYLNEKNYKVVGLVSKERATKSKLDFAEIIETNIFDIIKMKEIFNRYKPSECYHLAAAHHSSEGKSDKEIRMEMLRVNFLSTQIMIDVILAVVPDCRFLYAGSSQMYTAENDVTIIDENTAYKPSTYYGITKVASAQLIDLMRRTNDFWGVTVILFNHESVNRSEQFLSRKVTCAVSNFFNESNEKQPAKINKLCLNDVSARVDWSAASDFIRAFHLSLQADEASDFVLASGHVHTVRELLQEAFSVVGLDWNEYVETENQLNNSLKPCLQGNPEKAMKKLCWKPDKSFADLIKEMVEYDMKIIQSDKTSN
jgi:GDPmannose 4,6-dehydratase